jgi:hypothetical protein
MKADNIRDKEAFVLMNLVDRALKVYNLETQAMSSELPLNDEITLDSTYDGENGDNLVVYAVTKFSVVTTKGERIKFLKLDRDDIYTLQDIIADEYQLDINL